MIHHILNTKIANNDDAILLNFMISDMKILSKIEEAWSEQTIREDHSNPCKKRVRRAGYLGHVYRIAYDVQEIITGKENKKYFQEWLDCHEDPQFWQTFFDETLKVTFIQLIIRNVQNISRMSLLSLYLRNSRA